MKTVQGKIKSSGKDGKTMLFTKVLLGSRNKTKNRKNFKNKTKIMEILLRLFDMATDFYFILNMFLSRNDFSWILTCTIVLVVQSMFYFQNFKINISTNERIREDFLIPCCIIATGEVLSILDYVLLFSEILIVSYH